MVRRKISLTILWLFGISSWIWLIQAQHSTHTHSHHVRCPFERVLYNLSVLYNTRLRISRWMYWTYWADPCIRTIYSSSNKIWYSTKGNFLSVCYIHTPITCVYVVCAASQLMGKPSHITYKNSTTIHRSVVRRS